jgi:hypothetical protein
MPKPSGEFVLALHAFSERPECIYELATADCVPGLVRALARSCRGCRGSVDDCSKQALEVLGRLFASSSPTTHQAVEAGVVPPLARLLDPQNPRQAPAQAAVCLELLAHADALPAAAVVPCGLLAALGRQLAACHSEPTLWSLLSSLRLMARASKQVAAAVTGAGAVAPAVALLGHGSERVRMAAASAVCNLSLASEARAAVVAGGGVPLLLRGLSNLRPLAPALARHYGDHGMQVRGRRGGCPGPRLGAAGGRVRLAAPLLLGGQASCLPAPAHRAAPAAPQVACLRALLNLAGGGREFRHRIVSERGVPLLQALLPVHDPDVIDALAALLAELAACSQQVGGGGGCAVGYRWCYCPGWAAWRCSGLALGLSLAGAVLPAAAAAGPQAAARADGRGARRQGYTPCGLRAGAGHAGLDLGGACGEGGLPAAAAAAAATCSLAEACGPLSALPAARRRQYVPAVLLVRGTLAVLRRGCCQRRHARRHASSCSAVCLRPCRWPQREASRSSQQAPPPTRCKRWRRRWRSAWTR